MYGPLRPWACLSRWHPRSSYEGLRSKLSSLHDAMRSIFIATRCRLAFAPALTCVHQDLQVPRAVSCAVPYRPLSCSFGRDRRVTPHLAHAAFQLLPHAPFAFLQSVLVAVLALAESGRRAVSATGLARTHPKRVSWAQKVVRAIPRVSYQIGRPRSPSTARSPSISIHNRCRSNSSGLPESQELQRLR